MDDLGVEAAARKLRCCDEPLSQLVGHAEEKSVAIPGQAPGNVPNPRPAITDLNRDIAFRRFGVFAILQRMRWVVALLALATLSTPVVGVSASAVTAHVVVLDRSPLVVRGTRFVARESVTVRVVVRGGPRYVKTVRAGTDGRWTVRFHAAMLGLCDSFVVRAAGERGSRAAYTELPPPCGAAP